jgi:hypothetical protein
MTSEGGTHSGFRNVVGKVVSHTVPKSQSQKIRWYPLETEEGKEEESVKGKESGEMSAELCTSLAFFLCFA